MNQAIQAVAERYGLTTCPPPQEFIPIGIPALDAVTGGIPKGRIVDIHGAEDAGKTALALTLAKGSVLYIDAENKLDLRMIQGRKSFYIAHLETLEDALEVCRIAAAGFDTIVLDTVEAIPEAWDPWITITEPRENSREKLLSKALAILAPILLFNSCTLIVVNQMRAVPGIFHYELDHSTGGRALGYFASLRLEVRLIESVKKNDKRIGQKIRVRVEKNKHGRPAGEAMLTIDYRRGLCGK